MPGECSKGLASTSVGNLVRSRLSDFNRVIATNQFAPPIEFVKRAMIDKLQETVKADNRHGRLFTLRWKDEELSQDACFAWMRIGHRHPPIQLQV